MLTAVPMPGSPLFQVLEPVAKQLRVSLAKREAASFEIETALCQIELEGVSELKVEPISLPHEGLRQKLLEGGLRNLAGQSVAPNLREVLDEKTHRGFFAKRQGEVPMTIEVGREEEHRNRPVDGVAEAADDLQRARSGPPPVDELGHHSPIGSRKAVCSKRTRRMFWVSPVRKACSRICSGGSGWR